MIENPNDICIWVYFAKTLVNRESTGVLLDIVIRRIAHKKAPCFKADYWGKKVKRVVANKGSYTTFQQV